MCKVDAIGRHRHTGVDLVERQLYQAGKALLHQGEINIANNKLDGVAAVL